MLEIINEKIFFNEYSSIEDSIFFWLQNIKIFNRFSKIVLIEQKFFQVFDEVLNEFINSDGANSDQSFEAIAINPGEFYYFPSAICLNRSSALVKFVIFYRFYDSFVCNEYSQCFDLSSIYSAKNTA